MAEIEFFAVGEEVAEVVNWLLGQGCALAPDINYHSADITLMTGALEIRQVALSTPHFFVVREDLLESPLNVREVTTADKHFFYISPRTGGPSLEFYWGRRIEKQAREHLAASWLSYYPWYTDSVTGERKKISKGLLEIYSGCAKLIRARCRRIQPGKRVFFISPAMEKLVRGGAILIGLEDRSPDQILGPSEPDISATGSRG